jgi:hypothetical protein
MAPLRKTNQNIRAFVPPARIMRRWILLACWALGLASPAVAASLPVFAPMSGFSLLAPDYPPPPGGPRPYAQTSGPLQWSVGPWGSPGGSMPPFTQGSDGFATAAPSAGVRVTQDASGTALYLSQNGAPLACTKHGGPQEFDLFAEPNGAHVKPPRRGGYMPGVLGTPITALSQLQLSATLAITQGLATTRKHCAANFADTEFAVILIDTAVSPHQILFYQLLFSHLCGQAADIRLSACGKPRNAMEYYARKSPFGANDFLPLLGQPWVENNVPAQINVDLLPRLLAVVTNGPAAMDHDAADWTLGSIYLGQSIYGDTQLSSRWENVSLTAVTP